MRTCGPRSRKRGNTMLRLRLKRVAIIEPDVDPYRVGWTWGIEVVNGAGDVVGRASDGMTGPREAMQVVVDELTDELEALERSYCASCEGDTHLTCEHDPGGDS